MRQIGKRGNSARIGVRGAALVAIALFTMLLGPSLAAAIAELPLAPVTAPAPVNTAAPALTGTPALGQTLSCSTGSWANNPTSFSYTWLRSGIAIPGQSASTYVVQAADQGHAISCQVTAGNGGGDYTISGLPSGSYKVGFYVEDEANYLDQYYNGKTKFAEANPVAVTSPNATGGINAELHAGGQISGRVTDAATHAPVASVEVCAEEEVGGVDEYGNCAVTGSNGEYTVSGLQSGSYTVEFDVLFSEGDYASQYYSGKSLRTEAQQVAVTAGAAVAGINAELISLNQEGQISGTVTEAVDPISKVEVCAYEISGEYFGGCAQTNSAGVYTITGLRETSYEVYFTAESCTSSGCTQQNYIPQYYNDAPSYADGTPVPVQKGKTTENIDAKLVVGGQIEGTVTKASGGAPLEKIYVCADGVGIVEDYDDCEFTNSAGKYVLQALPTGEYTITFYGSENYLTQYYDNTAQYAAATRVSVEAGKTTAGSKDAQMVEGGPDRG